MTSATDAPKKRRTGLWILLGFLSGSVVGAMGGIVAASLHWHDRMAALGSSFYREAGNRDRFTECLVREHLTIAELHRDLKEEICENPVDPFKRQLDAGPPAAKYELED